MRVEVCEDNGLELLCKPAKVVGQKGETEVILKVKDKEYVVDRSRFRIAYKPFMLGLFRKRVLQYYIKEVPREALSVEDYVKLKQLEIEMKTLAQSSIARQMQLFFLLMVIVMIVALAAVAFVASRPTEVVVNVPQVNQTTTTPPVVVPPP